MHDLQRDGQRKHAEVCPFCHSAIDQEAAIAAAEVQDKANQSYSDASYARTAAVAMWVFLGLSFIPFLPLVTLGFEITFFVVIVMLIRWQIKFGGLKTADADYSRAQRSKNIAFGLWVIAIPAVLVKVLLEWIVQWMMA